MTRAKICSRERVRETISNQSTRFPPSPNLVRANGIDGDDAYSVGGIWVLFLDQGNLIGKRESCHRMMFWYGSIYLALVVYSPSIYDKTIA